jgi:hypothetical protein
MAIACFLLVTFFPLRPLRSVPSLRLRIADSTSFDALFDVFARGHHCSPKLCPTKLG